MTCCFMLYTDVDECETSPCQNQGACTNTPGGFNCGCPRGLEGVFCEDLNRKENTLQAQIYII